MQYRTEKLTSRTLEQALLSKLSNVVSQMDGEEGEWEDMEEPAPDAGLASNMFRAKNPERKGNYHGEPIFTRVMEEIAAGAVPMR